MLKLKQSSNEEDWKEAWDEATRIHTKEDIEKLKKETELIISNCYGPNSIIGYSGGKDSLVLRHMCEDCIENPLFINCILQNEFLSFDKWLKDTAPRFTVYVEHQGLSLEFLNKNLEYLFPYETKEKNAYVIAWRNPTQNWMVKHNKNNIITAKRTSDGNTCGKFNDKNCRHTKLSNPDIDTLNPMADWSHSQLLAYIQYYNIELPEIYYYPNGFRFGTHPWTERRRLNLRYKDTFDEIMMLDKNILINASSKLDIAKLYLEGKLNF